MKKRYQVGAGRLLSLFGYLLYLVGVAGGLLFMNFIYTFFNNLITPAEGSISNWTFLVWGIPGVVISAYVIIKSGNWLIKRGKKLVLKAKESTIKAQFGSGQEHRPPVLYLRSFDTDETTDPLTDFYSGNTPMDLIYSDKKTTEEQLESLFRPLGPFLCIGDPREKLPSTGAYRLYFREDNDTWRNWIIHLMQESLFVVIRAGASTGILWELEQALENIAPEKLVCLIIYQKNQRTTIFEQELEKFLFKKNGKKITLARPVQYLNWFQKSWYAIKNPSKLDFGRVIYFNGNWDAFEVPLKRPGIRHFLRYNLGQTFKYAFYLALQPALKQAGLELPKPKIFWIWYPIFILLIGAFLLVLIAIILE